ncbi:C19L2 protein, partial [Atractosteus spatula]|nr:C19L2 protein [Atractosteus spatula]
MAAYSGSFESANSLNEKKELKRKAREDILKKAKEQHERDERRKELRRARGEDTWMLPEVDMRIKQQEEEHSVKGKNNNKKKKKKEKKAKKSKKEKKKKGQANDSGDSSADSEDEWVEASPAPQSDTTEKSWQIPKEKPSPADSSQRDEWMTFDFLSMKTVSTKELRDDKEKRKEAERERAQAIEQAGLHERELNPFWKDGGTGLPTENSSGSWCKKVAVVDDGGLSWLKKSYQRMREQAERESRNLEDVVAERYGSMEKFQKRLEEAEKAAYEQSWKDRDGGRKRWRKEDPQASDSDHPSDSRHSRAEDRPPHRGERGGHGQWHKGDEELNKRRDRHTEERDRSSTERSQSQRESPRQWERKSSSFQRATGVKFLKPSETDDTPSGKWNVKPTSSSASALTHSSVGFQKPNFDDSGCSNILSWKKESTPSGAGEVKQTPKTSTASEKTAEPAKGEQEVSRPQRQTTQHSNPADPGRDAVSEEQGEVQILSDEDMNKLGAKLVKAELMGNTNMVNKLKAQLEAARKAKESQVQKASTASLSRKSETQVEGQEETDHEVVLFRTDQSGRAWPVSAPSQPLEPKGGRRKKPMVETHRDGERVRYFQDDDNIDLQEMVKREKMGTAEDQNALYSRMASKLMGRTDGDYHTLDDMFVSSAAQRERSGLDEERQRQKAVQEHRRLAGRMEKCPFCFDSSELPKHLIVAIGTKVYLCLPNSQSLADGHCLIVPLQHHSAATALDEDIWDEIQAFRKALVKMFEDQDQDCVFLETHMNLKKRRHMVYECIPLPRELGDMAPIYFKKAILESDEEWAMNKKLVDLSSRDIRRAVPKGLPYFSVDFGLQSGFAHVIENEHKFPHYFGKEIIGGMLDLEPRRWRKPIRENFEDQRKKVLQFAQMWKPFDCTRSDN